MHINTSKSLQPNPPLTIAQCKHGLFLVNQNDYYIAQSLIHYGEYSELELDALNQLLPSAKDAIEVGANIGSLSVPLAQKLRANCRKLMVVEPEPTIYQNLCANLALNGLRNVVTKNIGCSNFSGELVYPSLNFDAIGNFGATSMVAKDSVPSDHNSTSVSCETLDSIVPENFNVGLIKIDVEGHELAVLKGAHKLIMRSRPTLYLENDRKDLSPALIDWLWKADYQLWWDMPPLFNPNNWKQKTEDIFEFVNEDGNTMKVFSQNLICIPAEQPASVERKKVLSLDDWGFSQR